MITYPSHVSVCVCVCVCVWLQQLESLTFISDGKEFISSHSNGSYIIWNTASSLRPKEQASTPYGKYWSSAATYYSIITCAAAIIHEMLMLYLYICYSFLF